MKVIDSSLKIRCCQHALVLSTIISFVLLFCLWPARFATRYDFIKGSDVVQTLMSETTRNISIQHRDECEYNEIIRINPPMRDYINNVGAADEVFLGGEYYPIKCRAKYSSAIIVPYRRRKTQLLKFLTYMHMFLQKQQIHYRIFVVEQSDEKLFNRAKLLNIGYEIAVALEFPCLIFHDVDLLPSNLGQIYACSTYPRHMSSNLDVFRYNLPYLGLFGGVVSIRTVQFQNVNGMSNLFTGWGGEDDDFYGRIKFRKMEVYRFEPTYNEYTMMGHKKEIPSEERLNFLTTGPVRYYTDGLNSLAYKIQKIENYPLFTQVSVKT